MPKRKKVLVAEDEPDIRGLIAFSLQFAGYEVVQASNGQDAVKKAKEELPDLILLDVRMPRMSGYEACRAIKDEGSTQHIPIIFLSARGQDADITQGLALGANEYILKPFAPDELLRRVKDILQKAEKASNK